VIPPGGRARQVSTATWTERTAMTPEALSKEDEARLVRVRARLRREAEEHGPVGSESRPVELDEELQRVTARLDAARAARQKAQMERWEVRCRRRADRWALEREASRARAVRFVRSLFAEGRPVEVGVVFKAAAERGITTGDLMYASARVGVRRVGWIRSGTAPSQDRARGTYWGIPPR